MTQNKILSNIFSVLFHLQTDIRCQHIRFPHLLFLE